MASSILLAKRIPKPRGVNTAKYVYTPKQYQDHLREKQDQTRKAVETARRNEKRFAFLGRPVGKPEGTYVTDLCERLNAVMLCGDCKHKLNPAAYHYYVDRRFPWVQGRCDACRQFCMRATLFIHEGYLTGPGGYRTFHGQSWVPK